MSKISACALFVSLSFLAAASALNGAPFGEQFELVKVVDKCQVRLPGADSFQDAVEGQEYPYGCAVKTDSKASCVVKLSENNGVLVRESTTLTVGQDSNKKNKVLDISLGGVEVSLEEGFAAHNGLRVKTPSAECRAITCAFAIQYAVVGDLKTTIASCSEGSVDLTGLYFSASGIGAGEQVAVSEAPDGSFSRIKIAKGEVTFTLPDSGGVKQEVVLGEGDELEILSKESDADPGKNVVIYKFSFADPEKDPRIIQTLQDKIGDVVPPPAGGIADSGAWRNLNVGNPILSPTPVGRR